MSAAVEACKEQKVVEVFLVLRPESNLKVDLLARGSEEAIRSIRMESRQTDDPPEL